MKSPLDKEIEVSGYSVDVEVIEHIPVYSSKKALLRPIRANRDGVLGVIYQGRLYPMMLTSTGAYCIYLGGASFPEHTAHNITPPLKCRLPFLEPPAIASQIEDVCWEVRRDNFSIAVLLSAEDNIVEALVHELTANRRLNILDWGEYSGDDYSWSIHLSPGLSIDTVKQSLVAAITNMPGPSEETVERDHGVELQLSQQRDAMLSEFRRKLGSKDAQLEEALQQLETALLQVSELEGVVKEQNESSAATTVQKLKRGVIDRLLANMMIGTFNNLAFSPDSVRVIADKFAGSTMLWATLEKMNSGQAVKLEKLRGGAGKAGWMEVRKHISTGEDKRGRIYCRRSKANHSLDVVIDWKRDSKDQDQTLRRLANYDYFTTREVVLR